MSLPSRGGALIVASKSTPGARAVSFTDRSHPIATSSGRSPSSVALRCQMDAVTPDTPIDSIPAPPRPTRATPAIVSMASRDIAGISAIDTPERINLS